MIYLKNVATLQLDTDTCIGCGLCTDVCPHAVFAIDNRKAHITDLDKCMECGACSLNCPVNAIEVDADVGCATAFIIGALTGSEPTCDCKGGVECC